MISEDDVTAALNEHAQRGGGLYGLRVSGGGLVWHSEPNARKIVRACLTLGVPIAGTLSAEAWLAIAERLVALENRIGKD